MSHHLDSPLARQDVRLDFTDLYLFRGEVGTVFVVNLCHSIAEPIATPGFHPEGMYEFKIDLDGDAIEDLTYRFASTSATRQAASALSFAGSPGAARLIRTRRERSSRAALPARRSRPPMAGGSGRARPARRSGTISM
jgi:hypothetical protein